MKKRGIVRVFFSLQTKEDRPDPVICDNQWKPKQWGILLLILNKNSSIVYHHVGTELYLINNFFFF